MLETLFGFNPQLAVFILAMLPIGELRLALPLALTVFQLPLWQAIPLTIIGNFIPVIFLVFGLGWLSEFLSQRSRFFKIFFNWLFEHTRLRHTKKFELWGAIALITFVAIPLPVTGAWTGSVASFVFQLDKNKSLLCIFIGVSIAAIIVSLLTLGIKGLV